MAAGLCFWLAFTDLSAQATPERIQEHQQAAQRAEAAGDFETAIREYSLLVKWLPESAEVESNLGVALYFHHDLEKAAVALRRSVGLNASLYSPHLFLGLTKYHLSQTDAAVSELEKAVALNDADPLARTWLAYAYIAHSRYEDAVKQLETAEQLQPNNVDVAYALGQSYLELGKQVTARLLAAFPDGGRVWELAGEQAEAQGNQAKALKMYEGAYARRPDVVSLRDKVRSLNGTALEAQEQPKSAKAPVTLGTTEDAVYDQARGLEAKAKAAFERVSTIDPDSYRTHQVLGDSDVVAERFDDAILEYRMVLVKKPDLPGVHEALCNALSRTARIEEAIPECAAEIALAPYNAEAYVQAARVDLLTERYADAEVLLKKALTLDRPPIAVYKFLGQVLLEQKQYQAAATDLSRYVAVETKDSSAYYLLSRAYKNTGDAERMKIAIADYKRASDAARNASQAKQALDGPTQNEADSAAGQTGEDSSEAKATAKPEPKERLEN